MTEEKQQLEELIEKYKKELDDVESKLSVSPNHDLYFKRSSLQIRINGITSQLESLMKNKKGKKKKFDYYKISKVK